MNKKRKPCEDDLGGKRHSKPIYEEVVVGVEGCTELMKCAYSLDVECVEMALQMHSDDPQNQDYDPKNQDVTKHNARNYLIAGFSIKLNYFFQKYKDSDLMLPEKMVRKDRKEYESLFQRLDDISTLLHKYGV